MSFALCRGTKEWDALGPKENPYPFFGAIWTNPANLIVERVKEAVFLSLFQFCERVPAGAKGQKWKV